MQSILIHQTPSFKLFSFGNGWAYRFENNKDNKDIWFQDDDAIQFRADLTVWEIHNPALEYETIFWNLWQEYDLLAHETQGDK